MVKVNLAAKVLILAGEVTCMLKTLIKRRLHLFTDMLYFILPLCFIVLMLVTDNIYLSYTLCHTCMSWFCVNQIFYIYPVDCDC